MKPRILIVACLLLLAGCAQQPQKPQLPPQTLKGPATQRWQQHQQEISGVNHWQAEGRLAASNGNKGGNASFVWVQNGDAYQIKLFGPFGSGSINITGNPQFVEIRDAKGKITRASSSELLLKKVTGMQVPVNGLRYWLLGLPLPNVAHNVQQLDNAGNLKQLVQQGWHIDYENYHEQTPNLPNKLRLQNGNIKLKFVVTNWKKL